MVPMLTVTAPCALQVRAATVGYGDTPVVRDVSFQVSRGEVLALLGANASGKTTLVRGILGLATLMSGEILLFGEPAHSMQDRARVGYVPQRFTVGGGVAATVREVVGSGRLPRLGLLGRPRRADREVVARAIDAVNLADRADVSLATLSGGQQRRALIARALAAEPELLLLDEPSAGVDRASQQALTAVFARLVGLGVTMVVVTHEVGSLLPVLTRAVVMDGGRVAYDGELLPSMLGVGDGVLPEAAS
jgi:zinc transport system ATP-binding protein